MKILKSLIIIASLIVLVAFLLGKILAKSNEPNGIIYAQGGIEVTFEENGWPFFETNFLPGDNVSKKVTVKNVSGQLQRVGFRIDNVEGYLLSLPLFIKITDKNTGQIYYGGSGGTPLFLSYVLPTEFKLFDLAPNQKKELGVEIRFLPQAGNEFQGTRTKFDFSLGFIGRIIQRRFPFPLFR